MDILPNEIQKHIFRYVLHEQSIYEIVNYKLVCKYWKRQIESITKNYIYKLINPMYIPKIKNTVGFNRSQYNTVHVFIQNKKINKIIYFNTWCSANYLVYNSIIKKYILFIIDRKLNLLNQISFIPQTYDGIIIQIIINYIYYTIYYIGRDIIYSKTIYNSRNFNYEIIIPGTIKGIEYILSIIIYNHTYSISI